MLTLIDTLQHEYGWSFEYIFHELPLIRAFALYTAIGQRHGNKLSGPSYEESELIDRLNVLMAEGKLEHLKPR